MSAHYTERVHAGIGGRSNGDHIDREEILSGFPILGSRCLDSIIRLAQFDREQWIEDGIRTRSEGPIDENGLEEHARHLLECVQDELARRPSPLDRDAAYELSKSHKVALEALIRLGGNKHAKAVQAQLAPGPALAICTGGNYTIFVKTVIGESRLKPVGCLATFEDTARASGRMWPAWCPDCRPRNGKRNPGRDQARALKRKAKQYAQERQQVTAPTP